jgi:hypothetical protein
VYVHAFYYFSEQKILVILEVVARWMAIMHGVLIFVEFLYLVNSGDAYFC